MAKKKKRNMKKEQEPKTSKKLVIFPLLILVAGFVLGYFIYSNGTGPAIILRQYFQYLNDKNYEAMYDIVETTLSKEDFINRVKNIYEGIEASNISITVAANSKKEENSNISTITFTNSMNTIAGNTSFINTAKVKNEDEKYTIIWDSSLIFPDLDEDEKVRIKMIYSTRGTIYDRNEIAIAKNGKIYSVGIVPNKVDDTTDLNKLAELLNISREQIDEKMSSYVEENSFVALKRISKEEQELKLQLLGIKGVMITDEDARFYPYKEATSIMTGYVQDNDGKAGLEYVYNDKLKGTNGLEIYIDRNGENIKRIVRKDVKNGEDIKLTIDVNLQQKIYNQFKDDKGASVSINYKTGEVLSLVSTPSYDANIFSLGITEEEWANIQNDEKNPMYNRYLSTYVPGSIIKPIIGTIGLSTNSLSASEEFEKENERWQQDDSWEDIYITTLEEYSEPSNLQNALVYSDNIYFAKAALKIGKDNLLSGFKNFGFDEKLEFPQEISISTFGKLDSKLAIANTGYGQAEMLVNPIHVASIYSSFANDGNMVKPYLIYESKEENKTKIYKESVITSKTANIIKEDLIEVVKRGTAKDCYIEGKTIAGKTGTAEIKVSQDDEDGTEIGWFSAFDEKGTLIVSMIEDTKDLNGSHYVVNKVKNLFQ